MFIFKAKSRFYGKFIFSFIYFPKQLPLGDYNTDSESVRPVKEFPFYSTRLKPIDYEHIIADGNDFIDPYFPPNSTSILDENMMKNQRVRDWETLVWKRPKDVYTEKGIPYTIFENIGPSDIKQGKCGDCYFLSSLSALAEYPERIKKIFITDSVNEAGCYAVSLFVNGERKTVVVDDYFPYDNHRGTWAFSRPSEDKDDEIGRATKEIWVLILEKAWAKVFGSYQRIEAGTAGEAFYPLTGSPHKFFIHSEVRNLDRLYQTILRSDMKKFPMCTAVASQASEYLTR